MGYKYELHCHCTQGSACSDFPVREMVRFYKEHGYDGMVLTDHFSGNSTFPADMPWQERVEKFCAIYDEARDEGRKIGLDVFFGMECSLMREKGNLRNATGNDFLFLNLTKEWLLEHEEAFGPDTRRMFDAVHEAGGFIIHAHPFLESSWIECIRLFPRHIDAVEIMNSGETTRWNEMTRQYAAHYDLPVTGGSDLHHAKDVHTLTCIETEKPCHTLDELTEEIRNRRVKVRRLDAE